VKILHVVASYLPAVRYGGTIVSVHGLCRALVRRGHDVEVFTTSVDGPDDSPVPHGSPVDVDGVKVSYFRSRYARRVYWSPDLGAALRRRIREFGVVHTHAIYLWPLRAAARAAFKASVPYVISPRGMLEKDLIENKSLLWKAALIGFVEKHSLENAAAIHVTSRREADEARAFGFSLPPVCEIPNGVDAAESGGPVSPVIEAIASNGSYVLFLGRINWKKGLDRLIRAMTHAPGIRLVVAGNDEEAYRRVLDPLAAAHGVADRIVFAGPVSGSDKALLLRRSQLLVLPSYSENFGNVVLEAMAAGRPVLVTPEVGVADIVRDCECGVVAEGDPVTLGTALIRMTSDVAQSSAMGARGRELAISRYTWDAVAAQMEAVYQRAAAGRPAC
jgi:glycosyltransferase involved in cell wall biosynthesis